MEWEEVFAICATDKGLLSKIHKQLTELNFEKTIQSKNGQKTYINISPKKTYRWPNIANYNVNANQIQKEVSPYTSQNGYHQKVNKEQILESEWRKGNPPPTLLVEM